MRREQTTVGEHRLEVVISGTGRPLLFLHGGDHFAQNLPFIEQLGAHWQVFSPRHPGFGQSPLPPAMRSVDDLAYVYLDYLKALGLSDALVVGSSFGGWIASEICIRSTARVSGLVLIDSLGFKFGAPAEREIADVYALPEDEVRNRIYAKPQEWVPKYTDLPVQELTEIVNDRVALTRFGWRPYMHNPSLKNWMHRIDVPTLIIWGAQDGVVTPDYGRKIAGLIPGASFATEEGAGHFPHIEKPADVTRRIHKFAAAIQ